MEHQRWKQRRKYSEEYCSALSNFGQQNRAWDGQEGRQQNRQCKILSEADQWPSPERSVSAGRRRRIVPQVHRVRGSWSRGWALRTHNMEKVTGDKVRRPESETSWCRIDILMQALSETVYSSPELEIELGFSKQTWDFAKIGKLAGAESAGIAASPLSSLIIQHAACQWDLTMVLHGTQPKENASLGICDWSYRRAELEIVGDHRSYHMAGEAKEMRGQVVPNILSFFCLPPPTPGGTGRSTVSGWYAHRKVEARCSDEWPESRQSREIRTGDVIYWASC